MLMVKKTFQLVSFSIDAVWGCMSVGFEKPSAIQQRAIIPVVGGRDVIAQ